MLDPRHDQMLALLFDDRLLQLNEHDRLFNPLRVLGVQHYELRHVSTLAWLLDPDGSHDLGDAFLMRFMDVVATKAEERSVLTKIALAPDAAVRIRREVMTETLRSLHDSEVTDALSGRPNPEDMVEEIGRLPAEGALDLLIEAKSGAWVLGLEAKIRSMLHGKQLQRYREALEAGAPSAQRILVFLNTDTEAEADDPAWVHLTWQEAVIPTLKALLKGPYGRQERPASQFIASYLEVLEDLCADSGGFREQLLSDVIESHDTILNHVCGRVADGLSPDVRALVEANTTLFRELTRRYRSPNQRRLGALKKFVEALPDSMMAASQLSSVRFTPTDWLQHDWVDDKRHPYPSVVCELLNSRDHGYRFKLLITDLGPEHQDTPHFAQRMAFYEALQRHPLRSELFGATLKANGFPKTPEPYYSAGARTPWQADPSSDTPERVREFYELTFKASVDAATEVMKTIR